MEKHSIITLYIPAIAAVSLTSCKEENKIERPNILIIMADDMGYSDLGCYGSEIPTPNIDKLAAEGIRFTQFYNNGKSCPSRASLLTGLYSHQTGVGWMTAADLGHQGYTGDLNNHTQTLAEVLKNAGYSTYMTGKWHVTGDKFFEDSSKLSKHSRPMQRGFERYFGGLSGAGSYYTTKYLVSGNTFIKPDSDFYYTHAITDTSLMYLDQHTAEKPFFMYVAHFAPHYPLHALAKDIEKQRGKYLVGWDSIRSARLKRQKEMGIVSAETQLSPRFENIPEWNDIPEKERDEWDKRMAIFAAQVVNFDESVGKIVKKLKEKNLYDNTVIIILSDNGGCADAPSWQPENMGTEQSFESYRPNWANVSNTPFRDFKGWLYEGGISAPLIVYYPKQNMKKGSISNLVTHIMDIMPTCMEFAGANYPENDSIYALAGKSILPYLNGKSDEREALCWEFEANRAVRKGNWKLVSRAMPEKPYIGNWELYDLKNDRMETKNVAQEFPNVVNELSATWEKWAKNNFVYPIDGRKWNERKTKKL